MMGLPDAWELKHDLDPMQPGDATHDRDHDGATGLAEFLAGTDPTDEESVLRAGPLTRTSPTSFAVSFESRRGRTYALEATDAPGTGTWQVIAELPAENESRLRTIPLTASRTAQYFRLVTPRP